MVKTYTGILSGLRAQPIEVEVDSIRGTPQLVLIGLPSKSVLEAKERITAALLSCGVLIKSRRTVVNLAPADLPKKGSGLELAIAVSILKLQHQISGPTDSWLFLGELALDGQIKSIQGALPLCLSASQLGFKHVVIPQGNLTEVEQIRDVQIYPIAHLKQVVGLNFSQPKIVAAKPKKYLAQRQPVNSLDQIIGQEQAKRAIMIAAAGGHNILLMGPPGVGKSMLAQSLVSLLPPLDLNQAMETTAIHSVIGENGGKLVQTPPLRTIHHTITKIGLIGGGNQLSPGEISLAHHGVLFMDELTEFDRGTLEAIRQPLESGFITHSRLSGTAKYPCNFILAAAANPCPCGWWQSQHKACNCSSPRRQRYLNKLSGPLLDRIDLHIWIDQPKQADSVDTQLPVNLPNLTKILSSISDARTAQAKMLKPINKRLNSQLNSTEIRQLFDIPQESWRLLQTARVRLGLTLRGFFTCLRVAQTIAQLEKSEKIQPKFVAEALAFRNPIVKETILI